MFGSFARRLTSWYVVAAVILALLVATAFSVLAMTFYTHITADGISDGARAAEAFAGRASTRQETFESAATEFELREHRTGVRLLAQKRPPRRPAGGSKRPSASGPPRQVEMVIEGKVIYRDPRQMRLTGSRFGLALATVFGVRYQHVDFVDGDMSLLADPEAFAEVGLWLLLGTLCVAAGTGIVAWVGGRYITSQALRPLIDVTGALQRFAARDFRPHPIAVAGKSEFDAIALAYNAASAQVAAAFAERQQAETQMRQFVADASHELRTPLTIVLGYIDLLKRRAGENDERSKRIFSSIGIESARMRTLIDNLVLLARMEGDDSRPPEPFDLIPLLDEIVEARRVLHPALHVAVEASADATIIGNRTEIHEAVANVVDNAIKYAPASPIRIAADAVDGGVAITIADEGPGIHPNDREAIFDRFYRGVTRGDVEGSGLGLAIAKRAAERAGGTLALVQSTPAGTTFVLRLRGDRVRKREPQPARA